mgnify:CR=1
MADTFQTKSPFKDKMDKKKRKKILRKPFKGVSQKETAMRNWASSEHGAKRKDALRGGPS